MVLCYLSLGSNQKSPERQIRMALRAIKSIPFTSIIAISKLHWTQAWGLTNQPDFCNVVLSITTSLSPLQLLVQCQRIEHKQGRVRQKHWGPRTLDIDILLFGSRSIKTPRLTVPHPFYLQRDFVMTPLMEIYNFKH